jgi:Zn-finger nucleic acid-binding protein
MMQDIDNSNNSKDDIAKRRLERMLSSLLLTIIYLFTMKLDKILQCPNCSAEMQLMQKYEVDIDYCPRCKGIWLDRGEIDKIANIQEKYYYGRRDYDNDDDDYYNRRRRLILF